MLLTEREVWFQFVIGHLSGRVPPNDKESAKKVADAAGTYADEIARAFRERYPDPKPPPPEKQHLEPTNQELQRDHWCCQCGTRLESGRMAMCSGITVVRGSMLQGLRIAWCAPCWNQR